MAEKLETFISNWKNPAKTNMYKLVFQGENGAPTNELQGIDIRAKGAQLPTSEIGIMEIPYKGRKVRIPAERSFTEWTVTVMETNDMRIRKALEKWISVMDAEDEIKRNTAALCTIDVILLKGDNQTPSITYKLFGAFPSSLASVDLSFDEQTAPLEYSVTFQYGYHKVS